MALVLKAANAQIFTAKDYRTGMHLDLVLGSVEDSTWAAEYLPAGTAVHGQDMLTNTILRQQVDAQCQPLFMSSGV